MMEIIQKTKQTQTQTQKMPAHQRILAGLFPQSGFNTNILRDDKDHQMNKLLKLVGENTFKYINELIENFKTKNPGLSVINVRFHRALRKLLEDSERDSYVIDGRNINYTIKQYLNNLSDEDYLLKKVIDYQDKKNFLENVKWIKSPFSRILVIAILLGLKIDNDNTVTINRHKYSFSQDFDGILKKITPVFVVSGGSSSTLSSTDTEPLFSTNEFHHELHDETSSFFNEEGDPQSVY